MPVRTRPTRSRHKPLLALLFLAAAIVYLAGNRSVGLWDRDEPRYAQASRQMLQSGDWVVPHYLDEPRLKKPPLIYWCQASAMKIFGAEGDAGAFAARLPSVIAMLLTGATMFVFARSEIGPSRALWTSFILMTSALAIAAAKMCLTDSVLLLWVTIAQICFYRMTRGRASWGTWILFGVAIGLGTMTKGVALGFVAVTGVALFFLRPKPNQTQIVPSPRNAMFAALALVIALVIVLPWFIAMEHRIPGFLKSIIGKEIVARARTAQEGHGAPPGYYLVTVWGTYFPWSLILPGALIYAWKHRAAPLTRFALAATIGPWILVEVVSTKLPHYLLPVFPWIALLTARFVVDAARVGRETLRNRLFTRITFGWAIIVGLLAAGPLLATWLDPHASSLTWFIAIATLLIGAEYARSVCASVRAGKPRIAATVLGGGMLIVVLLIYGGWLPRVTAIQTSRRVAQVLQDEGATHPGDAIMVDYKEPTLAFYQGGTIREESDDDILTNTDPLVWPRWIVMTDDVWRAIPRDRKARLDRVGTVDGFWYASKARRVQVVIARVGKRSQ